MSGLLKHFNHRPCKRCGYSAAFHDRELVFPENGPPGSSHYRYTDCPVGRGTYRSPFDGSGGDDS